MDEQILKLAEEHRQARAEYEMLGALNTYGRSEESAKSLNESYWLAFARMKRAEAEMLRIAITPPA